MLHPTYTVKPGPKPDPSPIDKLLRLLAEYHGGLSYRELWRKQKEESASVKIGSFSTFTKYLKQLEKSRQIEKVARKYRITEEGFRVREKMALLSSLENLAMFPSYEMGSVDAGPSAESSSEARSTAPGVMYAFSDRPPLDGARVAELLNGPKTEFHTHNPYWIHYFLSYALSEELIDKDYFVGNKKLEELPSKVLEDAWSKVFGDSERFIAVFALNPKRILKWLKGPQGRKEFIKTYKENKRLYQSADNLREIRAKLDLHGIVSHKARK